MRELFSQVDLGVEPLWPLEIEEGRSPWQRQAAIAVLLAIAFGLLSGLGRVVAEDSQHVFPFCAADGVLAAFLLCRPRNRWFVWLAAAWVGDFVSILALLRYSTALAGSIAVCNVLESAIAALLLQYSARRNRDLASPQMMVRFLLFAVVLAPAVSVSLIAVCYRVASGNSLGHAFLIFSPHALGMAVMMPFTLALWNPDLKTLFGRSNLFRTPVLLSTMLAASVVVFRQTQYSLVFILLPLLMLVVFEIGLLGAIIATFEILVVGALYTLRGTGPFWMSPQATMRGSVFLLQAAVIVLAASIIPFAATLERQTRLRGRLRLGMKRYQLLADHSRDIIVLVNLQGHRLYVSPAVQDLLGWKPEEWVNQDAAQQMHEDDVAAFQRMLKEMVHGHDRRTFRYRTRHKDGRFLWMEASIRALTNEQTGEPNSFVASVRDISERVDGERKLAEAHEHMQQQAQRDSLTQLANRRRFDESLEKEWRRGRRTVNSVALLMVDIDHFKSINDTYGHRAGDQCLQILAEVLRKVARRPSDLVARYGGEEFAILLPDVDLEAATMMADVLCMQVREQLFEPGTGRALALTVSVGVAAQVPDKNSRADQLVEAADRALYLAKQSGRNCAMHDFREEISTALLTPVQ